MKDDLRINKTLDLSNGIGLYIHIPFCSTKCWYCDFNTYSGIQHILPEYLLALTKEIETWGKLLNSPIVNTVFIGGGTPSLLNPQQIRGLMTSVESGFSLKKDAEITAETNPDDITYDLLDGFINSGVNRLSMGVQSLDNSLLKDLGRRHNAETARRAFRCMREKGFSNVSLDLMYGLPNQTLGQWQETLNDVIEMKPDHISAYCLTLEDGTALKRWVEDEKISNPDSDLAADMYLYASEVLAKNEYSGYEISNWARLGYESTHNLAYWLNKPYLGVGPGSHSYLGSYRFSSETSPARYINKVGSWDVSARVTSGRFELDQIPQIDASEVIGFALETAETVVMGLRLAEGVRLDRFKFRFGVDLLEIYGEVFHEVENYDLIEQIGHGSDTRIVLTPHGKLLGNEVFWRIIDFAQSNPNLVV
ncbi:radical SAM family heme chaperone HemW [SAR202 cluster bacterium AD-802-E10_MRT_200m]|nr:radical SAM family heme chaperone HemW [SAR202 cluster bacterium AD-802-E10_MRT_200m]